MDAASAHRKIELQASEDLSYLVANVRRAAAARINEAFPPVDGDGDDENGNGAARGEDELRVRIEELVNEVCICYFVSFFYLLLLSLPFYITLSTPEFGSSFLLFFAFLSLIF